MRVREELEDEAGDGDVGDDVMMARGNLSGNFRRVREEVERVGIVDRVRMAFLGHEPEMVLLLLIGCALSTATAPSLVHTALRHESTTLLMVIVI